MVLVYAYAEVVRVGMEAALALHHAHQRGVIHRDVKPGNLLVDVNDKVWLTDFGLARRDVDVTATATGTMVGTPRYMSPEQISHFESSIDARTDVYSLGATLYEMATGSPPFRSESPLQLLNQIQQDEPTPLRHIDPSIPRTLELVILKCLDKDPARRYATAGDLADDLCAIHDGRPIKATGLPVWVRLQRYMHRHQQPIHSAAGAIAVTSAVLIASWMLWQQTRQARLGHVRINTPGGLHLANVQPKWKTTAASPGSDPVRADLLVTTPMQSSMQLPVGNYAVRMESTGNQSQVCDLSVKSGETTELEYIDRRPLPVRVDIHGKLAESLPDGALAVLGQESLSVYQSDGELRYSIPIGELAPAEVAPGEPAEDRSILQTGDAANPLTFAFDHEQIFQGDFNVSQTGFARQVRMATLPVDLDADLQPDLLVTAARHAALCAVSHSGEILWKRHLPLEFEAGDQTSTWPLRGMPVEAIVGIHPVADLDSDGIVELVVNAAKFDPQDLSRSMLFTLSGRDGSTVAVAELPTVQMDQVSQWPWSGLLRYRRSFSSDQRAQRTLVTYIDQLQSFSETHDVHNMRWGGNSASSALYVLPPLVFAPDAGDPIAATAHHQEICFFNTATGQQQKPSIALPQAICRGPTPVQLPDGKWGVMVLTGKPSSAFTECQLSVCVAGERKPRWSVPQSTNAYEMVVGAAESSFPMVVDLDSDGESEIITSTNAQTPFTQPIIECRSAATGELRWSSARIISFTKLADKGLPFGDIDQDGTTDLAILNLAGRPSLEDVPPGIMLVIDFINGRTGQRMGYREEPITTETQGPLEIDEVRCEGNTLLCSVVYGATEELELSSVSFEIDVASRHPASTARGLTILPGEYEANGQRSGFWYRQRSGPYAPAADWAVWLDRPRKSFRLPGTQLVTQWTTANGQPRLLVTDNGTARAVDPRSGDQVWDLHEYIQPSRTHAITTPNGNVELLLGINQQGTNQCRAAFYDADTGRPWFELDSQLVNDLRFVELDHQQPQQVLFALAGGDRPSANPRASASAQGYRLSKIDRAQEKMVWSKIILPFLECRRTHLQPSEMLQFDVNQDAITDLIVANSDKREVFLEAIDGRNGESLWKSPLNIAPSDQVWPWSVRWPQMQLVSSDAKTFIIVIDADPKDEQTAQLKCFDLQRGTLLSSLQEKLQVPLRHAVHHAGMQWTVLSPQANDGIVGLQIPPLQSPQQYAVFQIDPFGRIVEQHRSPTGSTTLTADLDHDGTCEWISIRNNSVTITPTGSTVVQPLFFDLPPLFNLRRIEQVGKQHYLVGYNSEKHFWIELPSGKIALESQDGFESLSVGQTQYPRLLQHASGTLLVGTTPEGPLCVDVRLDGQQTVAPLEPAEVVIRSPETDLRYLRPIHAVGPYRYKSFIDLLRLALLSSFAVWIPAAYIARSIFQRRWSLRWLLAAPPLTMLAIYSWSALATLHRGELGTNVFLGSSVAAAILSFAYLLYKQNWWQLVLTMLVSSLFATLFMLVSQQMLLLNSPDLLGYWALEHWLAAVLTAGSLVLTVMGMIAWKSGFNKKLRAA